jgi:predicted ABC-type ATPase
VAAAIEAGRIMLDRLHGLISQKRSFAFETTLSGRNHVRLLKSAHQAGYLVTLMYL